ncbi:MAG: hypothetical protein WCF67_24850 [Chitinophagaceae bacterium]
MKSLFQSAVIAIIVVAGLTSCKKETIQPGNSNTVTPEVEAGLPVFNVARNLVKKGTDSLVYNAGGTLTKVIYNPSKYVTYQKSGNILTASTFENNALKLEVKYTLDNGRTIKSVHTSWESNVGVSKTWLYDYDNDNRLTEKYNKDNHAERVLFSWQYPGNLGKIRWYSAANQHVATLQFEYNTTQDDKVKLNSVRSGLDPYLTIFGAHKQTMVTGEVMTYLLSPASNFKESHTHTYDRDGYPVKLYIYDPTDWTLKSTLTYSYSN